MSRANASEGEQLLPGGAQASSTVMAMGFAGSVTGVVLVCGALFGLAPLFFRDAHRVKLGTVDIDIEKQNGLTAELGLGAKVINDMSDSLHDNNGAYSDKGDIKRINGAYDNNAESQSGNVIRANGAMDNNALTDTGDVTRSNGVLMTKKGHGWITDKSVGDSVDQSLSGLMGKDEQTGTTGSPSSALLSQYFAGKQSTKQNRTDAIEKAIAEEIEAEEAKAQQRNQDIIKILDVLYGPFGNNTTDSGMDESSNQAKDMAAIQHDLMEHVIKGMGIQSNTANNVVKNLVKNKTNVAMPKTTMPNTNSTRMSNDTTEKLLALSVHKLTDAVAGLTQKKLERDVDIDNVRIKIKKQNGLQANVEAGIKVNNSMPHTLTHNNVARSKDGDVWRFNGIYDNNAVSKTADVLRVNGAYDNNAKSKDGSVVRNNGVVVAEDNQ